LIKVVMLGPTEFRYGDRLIDLPPLEKLIHIVLWLAGGTLTMKELAAEIWSVPSSGSASTIRGCLSRSRKKAVTAGAHTDEMSRTILVRGGRTRIRLPGTWDTDVDHFRRTAEAAREAYANDQFLDSRKLAASALSLWCDDPLPGAGEGPLAKRYREDLQDIYWALTLIRIKSAICTTGHREVIAELHRLVRDRPNEGEIPMLLATALYRSHRVAEAAKVCEQAIRAREAIGIEARRLQALQHAILNDAAAICGPLGW
jgi:DNA-binding SARP family transcriptional activator